MTHFIQKQFLHVAFKGSEAEGINLQRQISELCHNGLLPALEQALNRCTTSEEAYLRINCLEIDIGNIDIGRLEDIFPSAVAKALEDRVLEKLQIHKNASAEPHPEERSESLLNQSARAGEILLYFLENGHLPWYFRLPQQTGLEDYLLTALREAKGIQEEIAASLAASPSARQRLVWQFSPAFLDLLLSRISPDISQMMRSVAKRLQTMHISLEARKIAEAELWKMAFSRANQSHVLNEAKLNIVLHQAIEQGAESSIAPSVPALDIAEGGSYIENAGLVLLHPFLPKLFDELAITEDNALLQPDRALLLLHFMTTGVDVAEEHELVLPKILCNFPLERPVKTTITLSDEEKEETQVMLEAVTHHWEALRSTSPDGLRGNYLCRAGKLSRRDAGDWLLQVERRSYDILLDRLPWGIGMIKLPWMDNMVQVEW